MHIAKKISFLTLSLSLITQTTSLMSMDENSSSTFGEARGVRPSPFGGFEQADGIKFGVVFQNPQFELNQNIRPMHETFSAECQHAFRQGVQQGIAALVAGVIVQGSIMIAKGILAYFLQEQAASGASLEQLSPTELHNKIANDTVMLEKMKGLIAACTDPVEKEQLIVMFNQILAIHTFNYMRYMHTSSNLDEMMQNIAQEQEAAAASAA